MSRQLGGAGMFGKFRESNASVAFDRDEAEERPAVKPGKKRKGSVFGPGLLRKFSNAFAPPNLGRRGSVESTVDESEEFDDDDSPHQLKKTPLWDSSTSSRSSPKDPGLRKPATGCGLSALQVSEDEDARRFATKSVSLEGVQDLQEELVARLQACGDDATERETKSFVKQHQRELFIKAWDAAKMIVDEELRNAEDKVSAAHGTEHRCREMQASYLKDVSGLRDQIRGLPKDFHEAIRIEYLQPIRYLEEDLKNIVVPCIEEAIKQAISEATQGNHDGQLGALIREMVAKENMECLAREKAAKVECDALRVKLSELQATIGTTQAKHSAELEASWQRNTEFQEELANTKTSLSTALSDVSMREAEKADMAASLSQARTQVEEARRASANGVKKAIGKQGAKKEDHGDSDEDLLGFFGLDSADEKTLSTHARGNASVKKLARQSSGTYGSEIVDRESKVLRSLRDVSHGKGSADIRIAEMQRVIDDALGGGRVSTQASTQASGNWASENSGAWPDTLTYASDRAGDSSTRKGSTHSISGDSFSQVARNVLSFDPTASAPLAGGKTAGKLVSHTRKTPHGDDFIDPDFSLSGISPVAPGSGPPKIVHSKAPPGAKAAPPGGGAFVVPRRRSAGCP